MPIEFRCTQCDRLLRTPDGTAGRQARCPQCGTVSTIPKPGAPPTSQAPPPGQVPPPGQAPPPPGCPFAFPGAALPAGPLPIVPTKIDMGDIFRRTWKIFVDQPGLCIGAQALILGLTLAMQAPLMGLVFLFIFTASTPDFTEALLIGIPFAVVYWLACIVAGLWLQIGAMLVFLKIARGQPTSMWEVFSGRRLLLSFVGASIVVGLIVLGGYCLLIVPGVIFALMYSQTLYLVVDRNLRIGEALTLSQQLTYGNKATLFVMAVIVGVAAAMVLQFTGILGALVVNPIMALLWAVTYLVMTGQPTADRLYGFGTSPFQPQGWQPQGWQPAARPAPPPG